MSNETLTYKGDNIWSGSPGLPGALTNMTVLAKRKRSIRGDYPVLFRGVHYADAEAAFQAHKGRLEFEDRVQLMAEIIAAKLTQHRPLLDSITLYGGVPWLQACRHITRASGQGKAWEGHGVASPFIRALILGYEIALKRKA